MVGVWQNKRIKLEVNVKINLKSKNIGIND